jgi:glycosyltransferase involved in cell wall biosynthesis
MQSERPLLTIAIPTYNRSQCLTSLLEILVPQLGGETRVELIVSDNASQDETAEIIRGYQERGAKIEYRRNETNVGADANFVRCFEQARGEYVWIFGDDDIIVPGGLREVLRHLELRRYDLLFIRASSFRGSYNAGEHRKLSGKLKVFARPVDFALDVATSLTFISGNIIRKAALERIQHIDFNELVGTSLVQLSWTLSLLREDPRCACLTEDVVTSRMDNSGGLGTCHVFGRNLWNIVDRFFGVRSPIGRAILNRTVQSWFPWAMMESRRNRNARYLPEDAASILTGLYGDNPRYWFFLYPILRLPLPLAEAWLVAVKIINRIDGLAGYPIAR